MLNPEIDAKISYGNLKELIKEMSSEYSVKVGILGSKGGEEVSDNLDMAGLGAVHEFGATIPVTSKLRAYFRYAFGINLKKSTTHIKIPPRSFIRKPLERNSELRKKIKEKTQYYSKAEIDLAKEFISEHGSSGLLEELAYAVALSAVEQIRESFETGGFGEWAPDSPLTIEQKGSAMPLVDKGRLESSITFQIEKKG